MTSSTNLYECTHDTNLPVTLSGLWAAFLKLEVGSCVLCILCVLRVPGGAQKYTKYIKYIKHTKCIFPKNLSQKSPKCANYGKHIKYTKYIFSKNLPQKSPKKYAKCTKYTTVHDTVWNIVLKMASSRASGEMVSEIG